MRLLSGKAEPGSIQLSGPPELKRVSDQAVSTAVELNEIFPVLHLGAWLSVALALNNLLPLPAQDGRTHR